MIACANGYIVRITMDVLCAGRCDIATCSTQLHNYNSTDVMIENSIVSIIGSNLTPSCETFFKRHGLTIQYFPRSSDGIDLRDHQTACKNAIDNEYMGTFIFDETCIFSKNFFLMFRDFCAHVIANRSGEIFYCGSENFGPTIGHIHKQGLSMLYCTVNTSHHAYYIRGSGMRKLAETALMGGVISDMQMILQYRKWTTCPSLVHKKYVSGVARLIQLPLLQSLLTRKVENHADIQNVLDTDWQSFMFGIIMLIVFQRVREIIENNIAQLIT